MINTKEADFVSRLCVHINQRMKDANRTSVIGVITPYQQQKSEIYQQLEKWFVSVHFFKINLHQLYKKVCGIIVIFNNNIDRCLLPECSFLLLLFCNNSLLTKRAAFLVLKSKI